MKFCYKNNIVDWRIVILVSLLCLFHILTIKVLLVASLLAFCECVVLILFAIKQRLDLYLYAMVILLSTTLEFPTFVDDSLKILPSITQLPFLYGYFFLLLSLWPLSLLIRNISIWKSIPYKTPLYYLFLFSISTLIFGGIMGVISMCVDDTSIRFRISYFFKDLISIGLFSVYTLYFIYAYLSYPQFKQTIKIIIFSILVAIIVIAFTISLIGIRGYYGFSEIILMPLSFFFSTSVIIFFFYKEYRKRSFLLLLILSFMALFMQFAYSNALSGKSWLVVFFIFITSLLLGYMRNKMKFIGGILIAFLMCPFVLGSFEEKENSDSLSFSKLDQALALVSVVDIEWYDNLPLSPKIRIEEFINTGLDFFEHPLFLFFGKGFSGGHKDYRNSYGNYNPSAFSIDEYNNAYFISLHESLNTIFLKFGALGILLFGLFLFNAFKFIGKSPWLIIGIIWIVFFWGYSTSLMAVGLSSLLTGMGDIEIKRNK